jgi:hypothetical protein
VPAKNQSRQESKTHNQGRRWAQGLLTKKEMNTCPTLATDPILLNVVAYTGLYVINKNDNCVYWFKKSITPRIQNLQQRTTLKLG